MLKRCFIMSPSTISVFFGRAEFSDFDVVIVDEASQLEPTAILPLLFRAKQLVLVGDEWQMPPIKHFAARNDRLVYDGEDCAYMEPDASVLGLALKNCAFPIERLLCHYRSRTESLIAFSQKRFYDFMRTFPAAQPKAEGLGIRDVYVPDGCCENGQNLAEARAVVIALKQHFATYFKDGKLTESVGVVSFGENQLEKILSCLRADKELFAQCERAKANCDDLPEKTIFFKTIETVQGQETDHLILSITYGKNTSGRIVQSFGLLNRGKLGQCVFNVAVTRAKSSVTVVHSLTAEEITNPNLDFLAEYLQGVKQFSLEGREQFVGADIEQVPSGFLRRVAEFVRSCGVPRDRIVLNFGATEGSVRIPIAILSEDKSRALLGIWCETDIGNRYDYLDYHLRYFRILEGGNAGGNQGGWKLHRLYIHDWVDNAQAERTRLKNVISSCL